MTTLNIKQKPYVLLLLTAIALAFGIVLSPIARIDFFDKTMLGVPAAIFIWMIPSILLSFWLLYLLTRRFLYSMTITRIHILTTVFATILIVFVLYIGINPLQQTSHRYYSSSLIDMPELIGNAMQVLFMIFLCGQGAYLGNILLGILAKRKK